MLAITAGLHQVLLLTYHSPLPFFPFQPTNDITNQQLISLTSPTITADMELSVNFEVHSTSALPYITVSNKSYSGFSTP
jgi:hypothetical protein